MIVKEAKISQKMKNKSFLSIKKIPNYNYKKLFHLEKKKIFISVGLGEWGNFFYYFYFAVGFIKFVR